MDSHTLFLEDGRTDGSGESSTTREGGKRGRRKREEKGDKEVGRGERDISHY